MIKFKKTDVRSPLNFKNSRETNEKERERFDVKSTLDLKKTLKNKKKLNTSNG